MNDKKFENKVQQDAEKIKKDLGTMVGDGVSYLSEGFEKLKGEAKETVDSTMASVKEDIGIGLKKYNENAQRAADKVPGGFSNMISRYPWVALTVALVVGYRLGRFFKLSH